MLLSISRFCVKMLSKVSKLSPAKVNLTFQVLGKRLDGYHAIETLMQAVSLFDRLHFSLSSDTITCSDPDIPCDERNLVWKARELFRKASGIFEPIAIDIEKKIPVQAGLGGGSSNAATTLFALNEIFQKPLSEKQLIHLGSELGSDVPFFFSSGSALCTGRGEIFTDQSHLNKELTIVKPKHLHLSTPQVYKHAIIGEGLEHAAFIVLPELQQVKANLLEIFDEVTMSGSGTAFVCFGDPKSAIPENFSSFVCRPIQKNSGGWYTLEHVQSV